MSRHKIAVAATVTILIISAIAMAGTSVAVQTTVNGPDEVIHPDTATFSSTIEIRDDERISIDSFTVTIRSAADHDKTVDITLDLDGSIVSINPDDGVVGEGEIRIGLLERTTNIRLVENSATHGYGALIGEDERTGESHDFGYGYGYGYGDDQPTIEFAIELDARAFKHGNYELFVSVNGDEEDGLFTSNVHEFAVQLPSERAGDQAGGPPNEHPGDGPPSERPGERGPPGDRGGPPHSMSLDPATVLQNAIATA